MSANSTIDLTGFAAQLSEALDERQELRALLREAWKHGHYPERPAETLRRMLKERKTLIELLKKSGAVHQVGANDIGVHLEWLTRKFLRPIKWPGKTEEKS